MEYIPPVLSTVDYEKTIELVGFKFNDNDKLVKEILAHNSSQSIIYLLKIYR
jgi:hypothetical protein